MNKVTPGSNLMWESSRFMLPQHIEAALKQAKESIRKPKPRLDDQELEIIERAIGTALKSAQLITLVVFGDYEDRCVNCLVKYIDLPLCRVKVQTGEGYEWIQLSDVVRVE